MSENIFQFFIFFEIPFASFPILLTSTSCRSFSLFFSSLSLSSCAVMLCLHSRSPSLSSLFSISSHVLLVHMVYHFDLFLGYTLWTLSCQTFLSRDIMRFKGTSLPSAPPANGWMFSPSLSLSLPPSLYLSYNIQRITRHSTETFWKERLLQRYRRREKKEKGEDVYSHSYRFSFLWAPVGPTSSMFPPERVPLIHIISFFTTFTRGLSCELISLAQVVLVGGISWKWLKRTSLRQW